MNLRAYQQAAGKLPEAEQEAPEKALIDEITQQQHQAWLELPETRALLLHISSRIEELQNSALEGANAGWDKDKIARLLVKAKSAKEILEYATRHPTR